uniref:Putative toxin n=1 Tax=Pelinobius muticus TaxID=753628 RepID=D5J6Y1_PELMU|nr:putative toxin [Pelinobius muticus]
MNVILLVAAVCILTVHLTVGQDDQTTLRPRPGCRFDHCHLPKIPGCCEFFEAFRKEMDALKQDPAQSCKRFPNRVQQEDCKMQKILTARSRVQPSEECKARMEAFVQGTPPSSTTVAA